MEEKALCRFLAGENQFHNGEEDPEGDAALKEGCNQTANSFPQGAVQPRLIDTVQSVGTDRNNQKRCKIPHGLPCDVSAGLKSHLALQKEADHLRENQRNKGCQEVGHPAVGQVTAGNAVESFGHQGIDRTAGKVENIVGVQTADRLPCRSHSGHGLGIADGPEQMQVHVDQAGAAENRLQDGDQYQLHDGSQVAHHEIGDKLCNLRVGFPVVYDHLEEASFFTWVHLHGLLHLHTISACTVPRRLSAVICMVPGPSGLTIASASP